MEKFIRQIDSLGRIVIPAEYRMRLNAKEKSSFFISFENNCIILRLFSIDEKGKE